MSHRLSVADALSTFAGQDATVREKLRRVADNIACTAIGRHDFPVRADDLPLFLQFAKFLADEAELSGVLAPERTRPDAVIRDGNGERYAETYEPV